MFIWVHLHPTVEFVSNSKAHIAETCVTVCTQASKGAVWIHSCSCFILYLYGFWVQCCTVQFCYFKAATHYSGCVKIGEVCTSSASICYLITDNTLSRASPQKYYSGISLNTLWRTTVVVCMDNHQEASVRHLQIRWRHINNTGMPVLFWVLFTMNV